MPIGSNNRIHASAVIEGDVVIGDGNIIGPFVTISGPAVIGNNNWIGAGVVIGAPPEYRIVNHLNIEPAEFAGVSIGNNVVIREGAQVHQGLKRPTTVSDDSFIMNQSYVAHDCYLEQGVTLASSVLLAGTVTIGAKANLGMGVKVHQGLTIGALAMVGMGAVVTQEIPDYSKAFGVPARVKGANVVGLQRAGIPNVDIEKVEHIFNLEISTEKMQLEIQHLANIGLFDSLN